MIAGLTANHPLSEAVQLGALVVAMTVTSLHTIHPGIARAALRNFVRQYAIEIAPAILSTWEGNN